LLSYCSKCYNRVHGSCGASHVGSGTPHASHPPPSVLRVSFNAVAWRANCTLKPSARQTKPDECYHLAARASSAYASRTNFSTLNTTSTARIMCWRRSAGGASVPVLLSQPPPQKKKKKTPKKENPRDVRQGPRDSADRVDPAVRTPPRRTVSARCRVRPDAQLPRSVRHARTLRILYKTTNRRAGLRGLCPPQDHSHVAKIKCGLEDKLRLGTSTPSAIGGTRRTMVVAPVDHAAQARRAGRLLIATARLSVAAIRRDRVRRVDLDWNNFVLRRDRSAFLPRPRCSSCSAIPRRRRGSSAGSRRTRASTGQRDGDTDPPESSARRRRMSMSASCIRIGIFSITALLATTPAASLHLSPRVACCRVATSRDGVLGGLGSRSWCPITRHGRHTVTSPSCDAFSRRGTTSTSSQHVRRADPASHVPQIPAIRRSNLRDGCCRSFSRPRSRARQVRRHFYPGLCGVQHDVATMHFCTRRGTTRSHAGGREIAGRAHRPLLVTPWERRALSARNGENGSSPSRNSLRRSLAELLRGRIEGGRRDLSRRRQTVTLHPRTIDDASGLDRDELLRMARMRASPCFVASPQKMGNGRDFPPGGGRVCLVCI